MFRMPLRYDLAGLLVPVMFWNDMKLQSQMLILSQPAVWKRALHFPGALAEAYVPTSFHSGDMCLHMRMHMCCGQPEQFVPARCVECEDQLVSRR